STSQRVDRDIQYTSSLSSAEWIQEAPSVGRRGTVTLDDFGTIQFANGWATKNGQTVTIAQTGARPVRMIGRSGETLAAPSTLSTDGTAFSVDRANSVLAAQSGPSSQVSQSVQPAA